MKKLSMVVSLGMVVSSAIAQIPLEVKKIDLSGNGKSKNSRIVDCIYDPASKATRLTFATTVCEGTETKFPDGRSFQADGLIYNFEHLSFDESFGFLKLEKEEVAGLANALDKAHVLGKNFVIESPYGYVGGANAKGGWLDQYKYVSKTYANAKYGMFYCDEKIEARKGDVKIPFMDPPESVLASQPVKNGVMLLTQNSQSETTVNGRFFDHSGNKLAESSFKIAYGFAARVVPFKTASGVTDFIAIIQPTQKYNKYGIKIDKIKANPLEFEYVRIDGGDMKVKERFTFNAINTQWFVENIIENNGALYLLGQSSKKVALSPYFFGAFTTIEAGDFADWIRIDKLENYQIMKVKDGKMEYISAITPDDMEKVQSIIPGVKGSNSASSYFRLQELKIVNDKIYIAGQYNKPGTLDERKQEFLMVINETGKVQNLFFVPKTNYASSNLFFGNDNKTLIWAIYDYSKYEITACKLEPVQIKIGFLRGGDDHAFTGKRLNDDGPLLQLTKIDLTSNTPSPLQVCGKDEYTLFDDYPVLYSTDKEIVFFGVSGKAKERFANAIKVKF